MAFLLLHRLGMPLSVEVALGTEWYPASARSLQRVNRPSAHDCPTEMTGWIYFGVCVLSGIGVRTIPTCSRTASYTLSLVLHMRSMLREMISVNLRYRYEIR